MCIRDSPHTHTHTHTHTPPASPPGAPIRSLEVPRVDPPPCPPIPNAAPPPDDAAVQLHSVRDHLWRNLLSGVQRYGGARAA
eukprot:1346027-Prymnesium_polylepis.1